MVGLRQLLRSSACRVLQRQRRRATRLYEMSKMRQNWVAGRLVQIQEELDLDLEVLPPNNDDACASAAVRSSKTRIEAAAAVSKT